MRSGLGLLRHDILPTTRSLEDSLIRSLGIITKTKQARRSTLLIGMLRVRELLQLYLLLFYLVDAAKYYWSYYTDSDYDVKKLGQDELSMRVRVGRNLVGIWDQSTWENGQG
jgi:hypothetical protein